VAFPLSRIAFLGLGTMGEPMARNLVQAGFPLHVWNRSPGRGEALVAVGAKVAATPRLAAAEADVIVTMLTGADAVDQVLFGAEGAATGDVAGKCFVDCSTSGPRSARSVSERLVAAGARYVDAPVSGTRGPAERGELVVLAGGDASDVERLLPLFQAIGKRVVQTGPVGSGHTLKVILNGLGAQHLVAFASLLRLGERAGLSREVVVEAFTEGAFATPAYRGKRERVLAHQYEGADFVLDLVLRDADLCVELQDELGMPLPVHRAARSEIERAVAAGLGALDLFAIERAY